MGKIAIVVDSTSGLTRKKADETEGIYMIPLAFMFGEEVYLDGVDLTTDEFLNKCEELYEKDGTLPTTSQPSIGECMDYFEELLKSYDEIIYFTISEKMSGTYQSGVLASKEFDGKVTVVNSESTVHAQLYLAQNARKMADEGKSIPEILERTKEIINDTEVLFVVGDLKHLQRTGRIGAAAKVIGNALQLKPILTIEDGEVSTYEKVRNISKAYKKFVDIVESRELTQNDRIFIVQAGAVERAELLKSGLSEKYEAIIEEDFVDLSPVIAVNTGPDVAGAVIIRNIG